MQVYSFMVSNPMNHSQSNNQPVVAMAKTVRPITPVKLTSCNRQSEVVRQLFTSLRVRPRPIWFYSFCNMGRIQMRSMSMDAPHSWKPLFGDDDSPLNTY